ncbi:hypothetical protein NDU88_009253 [Pleurodeles waltl]|uniref:Uncharacterized protein n=1 Tax=Pleurodeles waltl TaxID=8319 RepID=A0AAV7RW26_PLEWA|nr:hypothetical protein NDU88_009253 [Pleurodeles waltl]
MAGSRVALPPAPMPSSVELQVVLLLPLVWFLLLPLVRVLLLPLVRVLLLPLDRLPPPLVWVLLLPLVRLPLLPPPPAASHLLCHPSSSFPGLRQEGLFKALRYMEVEPDKFLPSLHPGQERRPNWCPRGMAGAIETRLSRHNVLQTLLTGACCPGVQFLL